MINLAEYFNREAQRKLESEFLFWLIVFLLIALEKRKAKIERQLYRRYRCGPM